MAAMLLATAESESLWVWMPITPSKRLRTSAMISTRRPVRVPPLVSQRQSTSAPGALGGFERLQRVVGIIDVAVEEVLGVVNDLAAVLLQIPHRLRDEDQVLFLGDPEGAADVQIPALAEDRHDRRIRLDQAANVAVLLRRGSWRIAWSRRPSAWRAAGRARRRARRSPCPSDWSPATRPQCSRSRARRACAR